MPNASVNHTCKRIGKAKMEFAIKATSVTLVFLSTICLEAVAQETCPSRLTSAFGISLDLKDGSTGSMIRSRFDNAIVVFGRSNVVANNGISLNTGQEFHHGILEKESSASNAKDSKDGFTRTVTYQERQAPDARVLIGANRNAKLELPIRTHWEKIIFYGPTKLPEPNPRMSIATVTHQGSDDAFAVGACKYKVEKFQIDYSPINSNDKFKRLIYWSTELGFPLRVASEPKSDFDFEATRLTIMKQ